MAAGRRHHGLPRDAAATARQEARGAALRLLFQLSGFAFGHASLDFVVIFHAR